MSEDVDRPLDVVGGLRAARAAVGADRLRVGVDGAGLERPRPRPAAAPLPADGIDRTNCKPYETRTTIDGREMVSKGTACLQKDGTWRTIS